MLYGTLIEQTLLLLLDFYEAPIFLLFMLIFAFLIDDIVFNFPFKPWYDADWFYFFL